MRLIGSDATTDNVFQFPGQEHLPTRNGMIAPNFAP